MTQNIKREDLDPTVWEMLKNEVVKDILIDHFAKTEHDFVLVYGSGSGIGVMSSMDGMEPMKTMIDFASSLMGGSIASGEFQ